ncbi:hypothetical protein V4S28_07560 [Enterococcus cecorum]
MNYKDLILKDIKKGILLVGSCILLIVFCVIAMISYSNHRLLDASNQEKITFSYVIPNVAAETKDNHLFHISAYITLEGTRKELLTATNKNDAPLLLMHPIPTDELFNNQLNDQMKTKLFKSFEKTVKVNLADYTTMSVISSFDEISYSFKTDLKDSLTKDHIKVKHVQFSYSE